MSSILFLILALGVLSIMAYFYLWKKASKRLSAPIANLSIRDVWNGWLKEDSKNLDNEEIQIANFKNQLSERDLEELRTEL